MRERPCLVLIAGTLCDARVFDRQVRCLRTRARIVVFDYRSLRGGADWLAAQTRHLPPRFSVAGFSLGGLWALELLRAMPERIERLAMIASNAEAGTQRARQRSSAMWRLWRSEGAADVARCLKPTYFHSASQRSRHARLVRDMAQATPGRAARAQFDWAAGRPAGHDELARSSAPLLIVSGARDGLCPRALQQRMRATRPDARWVELPRCGHFVPLEAAAALSRLLEAWLALEQRPDASGQ